MNLFIAYIGILTVLIIALNASTIGVFLGVMDDPTKEAHKKHKVPTPLVGAVMVGILAAFIIVNQYVFDNSIKMVGISVCTILVGILGIFDDKLRLSWKLRLFLIGVISTILVIWVPELRLTTLAWSFGITTDLGLYFGAFFSVLCIMTLVIGFNMMDGFNGGVIGYSLVIFIVMALFATNPHRQAICLFIASALGIMLVYNMKGEFFLGDGGAYALGLLLGSVALLTYTEHGSVTVFADTIFVWLAVPALDCLRVVVTRRLGKNSPFFASRDHLHHILIGVTGPKRTLAIYIATVAGYSSLTLISGELTYFVLLSEVVTLTFFILLAKRLRA